MDRNVDLYLKIRYVSNPKGEASFEIVDTNVKKDRIEDYLTDWLMSQVGAGKDNRKANELEQYEVTIGLDMSDDTWLVWSNTGNAGLTCGIVMASVENKIWLGVKEL